MGLRWCGWGSATRERSSSPSSSKQDSEDYIYTTSERFLLFAHQLYGLDFIYQQDDVSIHTFRRTKLFLEQHHVQVLNWPARSPDFESLWSIMSHQFNAKGRQFNSVAKLSSALVSAWESTEPSVLRLFIGLMPRRCREVIDKRSNKTQY